MIDPLPEGQGLWYAPIGHAAEAVAATLAPYIPGRGILARFERRRVAAAVILGAVAAMPAEGTPGERIGAYLDGRGRSAEARAVMLCALAWSMCENPADPISRLPELAALLGPTRAPAPLNPPILSHLRP
jgi:hypothetical protein